MKILRAKVDFFFLRAGPLNQSLCMRVGRWLWQQEDDPTTATVSQRVAAAGDPKPEPAESRILFLGWRSAKLSTSVWAWTCALWWAVVGTTGSGCTGGKHYAWCIARYESRALFSWWLTAGTALHDMISLIIICIKATRWCSGSRWCAHVLPVCVRVLSRFFSLLLLYKNVHLR